MLEQVTNELTHKEWIALYDDYMYRDIIRADEWERLNDFQRYAINEIKKSKKRHARK